MMMRALSGLQRAVLVLLLGVALTATAYGHRMPAPEAQALAFALANGATAADLCGGTGGEGGLGAGHCLACQIVSAAVPPLCPGLAFNVAQTVGEQPAVPQVDGSGISGFDPAHPPQGPPVA
jgi:hypothetical protein